MQKLIHVPSQNTRQAFSSHTILLKSQVSAEQSEVIDLSPFHGPGLLLTPSFARSSPIVSVPRETIHLLSMCPDGRRCEPLIVLAANLNFQEKRKTKWIPQCTSWKARLWNTLIQIWDDALLLRPSPPSSAHIDWKSGPFACSLSPDLFKPHFPLYFHNEEEKITWLSELCLFVQRAF